MEYFVTILVVFVLAVVGTLAIMPLVIALSKKLKLRQTILHYVDNHAGKSGTPTFGGIGFIVVVSLVSWVFVSRQNSTLALVGIAVFVGYGIIGFLDDFIKIYFKRNKGLSVVQKIVAQLSLSLIVAIYAYRRADVGSFLWLPFFVGGIDVGVFAVPLNAVLIVALTNSVNLVDGLDGLACKVSAVFVLGCIVLFLLLVYLVSPFVQSMAMEYKNIVLFCVALMGGLLGFLGFNGHPAKIFMGDTGSLAIGGALSCVTVFGRLGLFVPFLGVLFLATALSVLLQVGYYKLTKKRIFLMAPLHHHFERKGVHENVISVWYTLIGLCTVVLTVVGCIWVLAK
ncbi:MAG: phospho-N-acetylmuramoyl-pentapeptide-transferase [Firmicutes bacterium]|nr:phospho-N-acetylmuramoyl-pentapeptide-transferase [Bacillota bacterium]